VVAPVVPHALDGNTVFPKGVPANFIDPDAVLRNRVLIEIAALHSRADRLTKKWSASTKVKNSLSRSFLLEWTYVAHTFRHSSRV
jgi:hypothetical protein